MLLEKGANVYSQAKTGQIPLHWAAKEGHATCIQILSKEGQVVDTKDRSRKPPLWFAVQKGHDQCVTALIHKGANINRFYCLHTAIYYNQPKCIEALVKAGKNVNESADLGITSLHEAAFNGYIDCVKMLIKMEANLWG